MNRIESNRITSQEEAFAVSSSLLLLLLLLLLLPALLLLLQPGYSIPFFEFCSRFLIQILERR